jgi:hypothetical protein
MARSFSLRSLSISAGVVAVVTVVAVGCSGSDFTASPDAGGDGGAGGNVASGASGRGGAPSARAGSAGLGSNDAGASTGGTSQAGASTGGSESSSAGMPDAGAPSQVGGAGGALGAGGASGDGAGGGCDPVAWYPDGDGDGFGRTTGRVVSCEAPTNGAWVTAGGDCDDDNNAVFPHEATYESDGYTSASSTLSYDYDCSTKEEVDPTQLGAAPNCAAMGILNCVGTGFAATNRTGEGVNPLCGSKSLVTCTKVNLSCTGVVSQVSDGVRCR